MSGNCATGMRVSANRPAIVMTMAMTTASRGRSTKIAEIICLPSAELGSAPLGRAAGAAARAALHELRRDRRRRGRRPRRHHRAGPDPLQPFGDDQLAFLSARSSQQRSTGSTGRGECAGSAPCFARRRHRHNRPADRTAPRRAEWREPRSAARLRARRSRTRRRSVRASRAPPPSCPAAAGWGSRRAT